MAQKLNTRRKKDVLIAKSKNGNGSKTAVCAHYQIEKFPLLLSFTFHSNQLIQDTESTQSHGQTALSTQAVNDDVEGDTYTGKLDSQVVSLILT